MRLMMCWRDYSFAAIRWLCHAGDGSTMGGMFVR